MLLFSEKRAVISYAHFLFFAFFVLVTRSYSFKLNAPSVLLNYNKGLPSNFTLRITGAEATDCFQWYSEDPQIIRVTPIFEISLPNCSQSAVISSAANVLELKATRITAFHNERIGTELICDVITDDVSSIELSWITDEMFLHGPPQRIAVIAKDKFGHTFTSINGLQIQWKVMPDSDGITSQEVVRLRKPSDSNIESLEENGELEKRGLLGSVIIVEPLNLGSCSISAVLVKSASLKLYSSEIKLKILPNLKVRPSFSIYLLRYTTIAPFLGTVEEGKLRRMDLSDFKVHLEAQHSSVIMAPDFDSVTAANYGSSLITYESINSSYPDMFLNIRVVKPSYIAFRISRGDFKTLEEMTIYEVFVDLYDENDNKIYPSDNLHISVSFPTRLFHVNSTTSNGTYYIVQTTAPGTGTIRAEFRGVVRDDGSVTKAYSVSGAEEVRVCQKLRIFPPFTFLPSDSITSPLHEIKLTVTGGTGQYVWAVNNSTAATLSFDEKKSNAAQIRIHRQVDLIVTVADQNNMNFISTAKISSQPVIDIETYPTVVEAEIGNTLIIPTALVGYENKERGVIRKFDDCSKTELSVEIIEKHVLSYEKEAKIPPFGKGCLSLQFRCKGPGHSRVNIFYESKSQENSNDTYKTTTVLSCYKLLKPVHPVRVAVVALGTSKEIAFEGGPRKWPLFKDGHYTELIASDPELVDIQIIKDPIRYNKDLTVFRVSCKALGENVLIFKIGNVPSATNQHPAKSETSIKFICSEPGSIHLKLHREKKSKKLTDNVVKVPFYGNKQFAIDIWAKDSKGRKFANISSLSIEWDVSNKALAQAETYTHFTTHENGIPGYRKVTRDFKDFKMTGATGELTVTAKVTGYRKEVLLKQDIAEPEEFEPVSQSINLQLVSLREINANLYSQEKEDSSKYCDGDACKA